MLCLTAMLPSVSPDFTVYVAELEEVLLLLEFEPDSFLSELLSVPFTLSLLPG